LLHDWQLDPAIEATGDGVDNSSPLLINTAGSLQNRPTASTEIDNLMIAADYVRTHSDLASMESANEAGRRATNAIIERSGATARRCGVWELTEPAVFDPFKLHDRMRYQFGRPHQGDAIRNLLPGQSGSPAD